MTKKKTEDKAKNRKKNAIIIIAISFFIFRLTPIFLGILAGTLLYTFQEDILKKLKKLRQGESRNA